MKRTQAGGLLSRTRSLRTAVLRLPLFWRLPCALFERLVLTIRSATTIAAIASRGFFLPNARLRPRDRPIAFSLGCSSAKSLNDSRPLCCHDCDDAYGACLLPQPTKMNFPIKTSSRTRTDWNIVATEVDHIHQACATKCVELALLHVLEYSSYTSALITCGRLPSSGASKSSSGIFKFEPSSSVIVIRSEGTLISVTFAMPSGVSIFAPILGARD